MGWALGAALTPALQRAYGWVGALLWAPGLPPIGPVTTMLTHIALVVAATLAVPVLMIEAASGRSGRALARLVFAVMAIMVSHDVATWLSQLDSALIATIAVGVSAKPLAPPSFGASVIDVLVFGVPYLIMLAFLALLLTLRLALLLLLSALAPLAFLLGVHDRLQRLPLLWFWYLLIWSLLPAAEAFVLVGVRGLAGELPLAAPSSDMLLAFGLLYVMLRLPFSLFGLERRFTAR